MGKPRKLSLFDQAQGKGRIAKQMRRLKEQGLLRWQTGQLIWKARQEQGLTRDELAKLCNLKVHQISSLEAGFSPVPRISIKRLLRLAKKLGIEDTEITKAYLQDLRKAGAKKNILENCPTSFSRFVRFKRMQVGLTHAELASKLKVGKTTILRLETSKMLSPTTKARYIPRLAKALDVAEEHLYQLLEPELKQAEEQKIRQRQRKWEESLPSQITSKDFDRLLERERKVLELRKTHTLEETGKILGITREGVRQIEKRGLRKLRTYVLSKGEFKRG
jgi:transcriptional regulator with XRE-family HTH domain